MRIAVDVMGGDHGCPVVVNGVRQALESIPAISVMYLVGVESEVQSAMAACSLRDPRVSIVHASEVLTMEDKPIAGLRKKKDCSLSRAIDLVKTGEAEAVISPGNTGGLVAVSTVKLRALPGVERPAIATVIPAPENEFVLLDAGATPDCKPENLLQFAVMGSIYSREILGYPTPRVGILSNGTEDIKGTELTRKAAELCRQSQLNFIGYVEGHDLFSNRVDVVVTDGFTGNIVLKTCESMGKAILSTLKSELTANWLRRCGALIAKGAFKEIKRKMDSDVHGGAPLLGLNGNVIKAHGSARETAIRNAVRAATEFLRHQLNDKIQNELEEAVRLLKAEKLNPSEAPLRT